MEGFVGLNVFTNLGTRFALAALRSHTFAELKEILKEIHQSRFPEWGEITIAALLVEVFSLKYLIVESIAVGMIYKQAEGSLELVVPLEDVGSRTMDSAPVQTSLPADSWMNISLESSVMPSERDLVTVASSDNLNSNKEKSLLELSVCESPDLRLSLSLNKKAQREGNRLSMLYSRAMDNLVSEEPVVIHSEGSAKGSSFHDADPMEHRCPPGNHSTKHANFTSDTQMDCCKVHEQPVNAYSTPDRGVSNANAKNSLYAKGSQAEKDSVFDREVSGNDSTSDHEKDLLMLRVKPEECANARGTFGTIIDYISPKDPTVEATGGACQKNVDLNSEEHSDSTSKLSKLRDSLSSSPVVEHEGNNLQNVHRGQSKESTPVSEYPDEQTAKSRDPENVATTQVTGSSAGIKGAAWIKMNAVNDEEEARVMTSDCIGVGFGNQLNRGTSLRQNVFLDDINIKSRLSYSEKNVLKASVLSYIQPQNNSEIQNCNASDIPEAKTSNSCDVGLSNHEKVSHPTNSAKESILLDKYEGRLDLENSLDTVLWMQENGGWTLKSCSETKSVEAKKHSRNRKKKRVQALELKESNSALACSEETKLVKNGRVDTPAVDSQGPFTLGTHIRKLKRRKCVLTEEAVNLYMDAQVKNTCHTGSVENEIFEAEIAHVTKKVARKRSPFLTKMELANSGVADENPTLLKKDRSDNMPHLDTQRLFGNNKKKTKSQKKQKRPTEALESTCQLKENGSNYRLLLGSQTLGNAKKKTKSQKKWKATAKALESTRQLKEDGNNYRPLLGSQTLCANGLKKTKSQEKRKRPTKALESTCLVKEVGSNYRTLLDSQALLSKGMKKTKSQKKQKRPVEALVSTCQLKEDGGDYQPLLDSSQTLSGNGKKKRKSPLLDSTQTLSGNGKKKRKSRKKRKSGTKALESTCQLKEEGSNFRPLFDSQTLFGSDKKKTKSRKKRRTAEALKSICQGINIEEGITDAEPHILTKISSFPSKRHTKRVNAASVFCQATDLEAVGYSNTCANTEAMNQKRKKSKKERNPHVNKLDVCCEHLRIECTCNTRTFEEENTQSKDACFVAKNKQSKVERERKFSRALLRMTFIKFPKLVRTMACPILRRRSKQSKA